MGVVELMRESQIAWWGQNVVEHESVEREDIKRSFMFELKNCKT